MILRFLFSAALFFGVSTPATAQLASRADGERLAHDAVHYDVRAMLPDSGLVVRMQVRTRWRLTSRTPIRIDLDSALAVDALTLDGQAAAWTREGNAVLVTVPPAGADTVITTIRYHGAPSDGLVIRGEGPTRTIFADNWPDRARHWLASQDHPSDKATISWTIDAPAAFTVVANGPLIATRPLARQHMEWRFSIAQPIPVHTMVLGATRMATTRLRDAGCPARCIPVSIMSYPADSASAVAGPFRRATEIVEFFDRTFGPFPYDLLRHVESSTRFGGMENSTAIFYDEKSWHDGRLGESTVAHETAHQWFGDAVSQSDWHHLWLSEGFATYAAALWAEHLGGDSALRATMEGLGQEVYRSAWTSKPILDTTITDRLTLLNSNNYPRGAWVLHSLRGMMGDSAFFRGLRTWYQERRNGNGLSADFAATMSVAAGTDLGWYFTQQLTRAGYPRLAVSRRVEGGRLRILIRQSQPEEWGLFRLPNLVVRAGGETRTVDLRERETVLWMPLVGSEAPPVEVDPAGWWLLELRGGS